jgi:hypothetical protein
MVAAMGPTLPPVWRDYRNRRRHLLAMLAVVPALAGAAMSLPVTAAPDPSFPLLLALWTTSFVAATVRFGAFRCPFCACHFHWTWLVANPLSSACLHCGFRKWRDPHAARAYTGR